MSTARARARNPAVAVLSSMIVALMFLLVLSPTQDSFAATMESSPASSRLHMVFYGAVTDDEGAPIEGAQIVVYSRTGQGRAVHTRMRTDAEGRYRQVQFGRASRFEVQITYQPAGEDAVRSNLVTFAGRRGTAYRVNAQFVRRSAFVFFPVFSY